MKRKPRVKPRQAIDWIESMNVARSIVYTRKDDMYIEMFNDYLEDNRLIDPDTKRDYTEEVDDFFSES